MELQAQRFCDSSALFRHTSSSSAVQDGSCVSFLSGLIRELLHERYHYYMWRLHRDSQRAGFLPFDELEGGVFCFPRKITYLQELAMKATAERGENLTVRVVLSVLPYHAAH